MKGKYLIVIIIAILLMFTGCAMRRVYVPLYHREKASNFRIIRLGQLSRKTNRYDAIFREADSAFNVKWKDSIKNPENAEFIDEVSFNEGIPYKRVTQKQFNKRYEIK